MPTRTYDDYRALRVFPGLDLIRGGSIVAVVWHHAGEPIDGFPLSTRGFCGVDAFFVLSGFLIVTLLLRERERHGQISLGAFYGRRTLRIFPLYYGLLWALSGLLWWKPDLSLAASFWDDLPALLTYTSNWVGVTGLLSITWSLAAEEQFYLLWPPLERWCARWIWLLGLVGLLVNQAANFGWLDRVLPPGRRHEDLEILQTTFTPIVLGVGLAHGLHHRERYGRWVPWLARPWVRAGLGLGLLGALSLPIDLAGWPRLWIHLSMTGLLAVWVTRASDGPRWRWLARLGQVSYGVYLLHLFVLHAVREFGLKHLALRIPGDAFVACLLGTWLVAEVSERWFERPIGRLRRHFDRG